MATETLYPANADAEPGKGTICSSVSLGSPGGSCDCDASSVCACCRDCTLDQESIRFRTWDTPTYDDDYTALKLKFSWAVAGGSASCTTKTVYVEYSKNTGSTWASCAGFPKVVSGSASGTSTTNIAAPISPFSNTTFRVRAWADAVCDVSECSSGNCSQPGCAFSNCTTSIDIDNLRLEGTYAIGACCLACGSCQSSKTPSTCSGTFAGDGTSCTPNNCTQPNGACCVASVCSITKEAACGGTWKGCGTNCTPSPCALPTGSCCDDITAECTVTTEAGCSGGTWNEGGTCTPSPCGGEGGGGEYGGMIYSFGF